MMKNKNLTIVLAAIFLPIVSMAELKVKIDRIIPSNQNTIIKGVSNFSFFYYLENESTETIEAPQKITAQFWGNGTLQNVDTLRITQPLGPYQEFKNDGQAFSFFLDREVVIEFDDVFDLAVSIHYEINGIQYADTISAAYNATDASPTFDLSLESISPDNQSFIDFNADMTEISLTAKSSENSNMTLPLFTNLNYITKVNDSLSFTGVFVLQSALQPGDDFTIISGISPTILDMYHDGSDELNLCFIIDMAIDVNPENDTLCVTYYDQATSRDDKTSMLNQLKSFPNPTKSHTQIQWHNQEAGQVEVQLLNLQGQVLLQQNLGLLPEGLQQFNLDLQAFPKGAYFYTLQLNGEIAHGKIIKQ